MKSQDAKTPKRISKKSAAYLAARAAEAEKQAETARNLARVSKSRFKEARKAYKQVKKFAKQARKEAKAAAKALKAKIASGSKKAVRRTPARVKNRVKAARDKAPRNKTVRPARTEVPQAPPQEVSSGDGVPQP